MKQTVGIQGDGKHAEVRQASLTQLLRPHQTRDLAADQRVPPSPCHGDMDLDLPIVGCSMSGLVVFMSHDSDSGLLVCSVAPYLLYVLHRKATVMIITE